MISPTRVEVWNVGSIPHAVIEPHQSGITALDGPTGSGKSTMVNAIAWCLYGYVGGISSFVRQADLRSDFCPDGEKVAVRVEFSWAGQDIVAVRRLSRSKRGKETASAELWVDRERQAAMSPDKLTEKIVEMTGMSGRAYTSAFFIPQHHLEHLAMGTPAEVQQVIEDQTGLSALTRQIAAAADEVRDKTAAADALPGSREEVDEAAAALDAAQKDGEKTWEAYEAAQVRADRAHAAADAARLVVDELQQRRVTAQRAAVDHARAQAQQEAAAATVAELAAELQASDSLDEVALRAEKDALKAALSEVNTARAEWDRAADALACAADRRDAARQQARAADVATAQAALDEVSEQVARADTALGVLRARYQQTQASISAVDASGPGHECPTCGQGVDDLATLRSALADDLNKITEEAKPWTAAATTARAKADPLTRQIETARTYAAAVTVADREYQRALDDRARAKDRSVAALNEVRAAVGDRRSAAPMLDAAEARADVVATLLASADRLRQVRARHDKAVADEQAAQQAAQRAAEAAKNDVGDGEWAAAAAAARDADAEWRTVDALRQEAQMAAQTARGRAEEADRTYARVKTMWDAKVAAVKEADTLRLAHAVLTMQRLELLTQFTAAVSSAASEVMAQAGGGRHVGVVLDETFVPRVVLSDGRERPFRNCSGGEKLRAALCLCLGQVAMQTSGTGQQGMIVADEIATGYDAETTAAVMDMIAGLGRPMILIGHNESVRQIANKVYRFTNTEGAGTTITDASQAAALALSA